MYFFNKIKAIHGQDPELHTLARSTYQAQIIRLQNSRLPRSEIARARRRYYVTRSTTISRVCLAGRP
nr:hypothetical protein [Tanacetum cinerariifolium]